MAEPATDAIRLPAELRFARELAALAAADSGEKPAGWALSPAAVVTFVSGSGERELDPAPGDALGPLAITRKFYGDDLLVQRAVVTLASDRGLLLIGEPGTAKSWLSELLAAAISGASTAVIHGTAGLTEDQVKYGWNYALLLAEGPSTRALVPAPLYHGMRDGRLVRFEEITRATPEVQDTLLSCLSEKAMAIPELPGVDGLILAKRGFNLIATANTRDRGVNEMSAALKRRFNFETVAPIPSLAEEALVVRAQVAAQLAGGPAARTTLRDDVLDLLVTTFHELRSGETQDGVKLERPSAAMSTAEAVGVGVNAALFARFFGASTVEAEHVVLQLAGTAVKDQPADLKVLRDYWEIAVKPRAARELGAWKAYWAARGRLAGSA